MIFPVVNNLQQLRPLFYHRYFFILPSLLWLLLISLSYLWNNSFLERQSLQNGMHQGQTMMQLLTTSQCQPIQSRINNSDFDIEFISTFPSPDHRAHPDWLVTAIRTIREGHNEFGIIIDKRFRYIAPVIHRADRNHPSMKMPRQNQDCSFAVIHFPDEQLSVDLLKAQYNNQITHLIAWLSLFAFTAAGFRFIRTLLLQLRDEQQTQASLISHQSESLALEINRHKAAKQKLKTLSNLDDLTGLFNRRHFINALSKEINRHRRYHSEFSLLLIDIDHLKQINEEYGDDAGDQVIITLAKLIRQSLRDIDMMARYSSEQFVILAPNTRLDSGNRFAHKLLDIVRATPVSFQEEHIDVSISIGLVSPMLQKMSSQSSLLELADQALRQAKSAGRDQVVTAAPS